MKYLLSLTLTLLVMSSTAMAEWTLLNDQSTLHFISIKKSAVAEVNSFQKLQGSINANGKVSLNIDLASVTTNIAIRDERLKNLLFEIIDFPQANIAGKVDLNRAAKLKVGDVYADTIKLKLSLHGITQDISSYVQITKLTDNRLLVSSAKPLVLNAADFQLTDGIEKLRVVANLPSISSAVPVSYNLVLKQQGIETTGQ